MVLSRRRPALLFSTIRCGLIALLLLGVSALAATGCGGRSSPSPQATAGSPAAAPGKLTVLATRGTLPRSVVARFRARFPAVTLRVVVTKNGITAQQLLRSGLSADLIAVRSDDATGELTRSGALQPVATDRIAAWPNLFPAFRDLAGAGRDAVAVVPVGAGEVGIISRAGLRLAPRSFTELFGERFRGRLAFPDNSSIAVQAAALALGYDAGGELSERQWERVRILLKGRRHWFRGFWQDVAAAGRLFADGRIDVTVGTQGEMLRMERAGVDLRFVPAREGSLVWLGGFGISRGAADPEAALAFIEYLLEPRTQAEIAVRGRMLAVSELAVDELSQEVVRSHGLDRPARLANAIPIAPELDHVEWVQTWYAVKTGLTCCL